MPSPVESDSGVGRPPSSRASAAVTVTFGTHKVALFVDPAAQAAGSVELVDAMVGFFANMLALRTDHDEACTRDFDKVARIKEQE